MSYKFSTLALAAGITCYAGLAAAQEFPQKQITMIVPFAAGGGSDRVARTVDQFWSETTGQGFNFQYFEGAGGAVGTNRIAQSELDGHTIGIVNAPEVILQPISGIGTFSLSDFDFIGQVNSDPLVLMVPNDSPYETLEDFIAAAKKAPGQLTLAVSGSMGPGQIVALQLREQAGVDVTIVPTQGGANTAARVAGGHVTAGTIGLGLFSTQEAGRALAVTSSERSEIAPDIPTFTESGVDVEMEITRIVVGPDGIPGNVLEYLRTNLEKVVASEGFKEASADQGLGAVWRSGEELEQHLNGMQAEYEQLLADE